MERIQINPKAKGLRPSKACAVRLLWAKHDALDELLSAVHSGICPRPLYENAVKTNHELIARMTRDYQAACLWESQRYGDVAATITDVPEQLRLEAMYAAV